MFPPLVSTVHVCNANGAISFKFRCLHSICCYINGWNSRLCYNSNAPPNHLRERVFRCFGNIAGLGVNPRHFIFYINEYQKQQSLQKILNSCHCFFDFFLVTQIFQYFLKTPFLATLNSVFPTPQGEGALRVARFSSGRNPTKFQNHLGNSTNQEAAYGHGCPGGWKSSKN